MKGYRSALKLYQANKKTPPGILYGDVIIIYEGV